MEEGLVYYTPLPVGYLNLTYDSSILGKNMQFYAKLE